MKVSVVIPTYSRRQELSRTLPTILDQDFPSQEYEVIVVVDGSTDGTVEMLRDLKPKCEFRFMEQPNRGQAVARNAGWRAAQGAWILFLDDDMLCDRSLVREHVKAHQNSEIPLVAFGPVPVSDESPPGLMRERIQTYTAGVLGRLARRPEARWPDDAMLCSNTSVARSVLAATGGFDESFYRWFEDIELGLRLWKMGVRFEYVPSAVAFHLYCKSPHTLVTNQFWNGKNQVLLCRRHPEYRPHSNLTRFGGGNSCKRIARRMAATLPIPVDLLLRIPFQIANLLLPLPGMRRAANRLYGMRASYFHLRGALHEAGSWKYLRQTFWVELPVFLYHHVGPRGPAGLSISPEKFASEIQWLASRGYTGIRSSDWLRWRREGHRLPERPVLLTFDDAYEDIAEYALPVLRRFGFGATIFVVTGQVGGTNAWDEARGSQTHRIMTAEQIRYWTTQGIEFGAHSRTHPDLTTLTAGQLVDEVAGSASDLQSVLGVRVVSFAYPYGAHNQEVRNCVRGVLDLAFTTEEGLNRLQTDPYLLHRTLAGSDDWSIDLESRVRWGRRAVQHLRARVRLRSRLRRCFVPGGDS